MDSNDNSTDKEDSCGTATDINPADNKSENAAVAKVEEMMGSNMKLQMNKVPAANNDDDEDEEIHTGEEEEEDDVEEDEEDAEEEREKSLSSKALEDDVEMKALEPTTPEHKNAGILPIDTKNNTSPTKTAGHLKDNTTSHDTTIKDNITLCPSELPSSIQSPPSLNCESDDKTQSSCISSPHASTPGSTPPSATVVSTAMAQEQSPAHSSGNTPPTDISTPKHSPESIAQSPSSQLPAPTLGNNCIQQPINVVRNGTIPNAGKPLLSTMSKKLERAVKPTRSRRPRSAVAMYESEVRLQENNLKFNSN